MAASVIAKSTLRERHNWLIHQLYSRGDYDRCLALIEEELEATNGLCEYAIYVKAMICRQQGKIRESLQLFQAATCLSPRSVLNLKQVARSLHLLGRHRQALEVLEEAARCGEGDGDWEILHFRGVCLSRLGDLEGAVEALMASTDLQRHEETYLELAKAFERSGDAESAQECLTEAAEEMPDSPRVLGALGTLCLRRGDSIKAFEHLGNALARDPRDPSTILAAGSILQDNDDPDVALSKYRVAAVVDPFAPELWNNVGMAFFAKRKLVAAVSCLKRAQYLAPFEWRIAYNLGVVFLASAQWASAFTALSAAINVNPKFAKGYSALATALQHLDDPENAAAALKKAAALDPDDILTRTNLAIFHHNRGEEAEAHAHAARAAAKIEALSPDQRAELQPDIHRRLRAMK